MTTQPVIDTNVVARDSDHWEIVSANYENGEFHIEFKDGTQGTLTVKQFPDLVNATDIDFEQLQVSPCGLILENDSIEWDYAEAGLYQLVIEGNKETDSNVIDKESK